MSDHQSVNSICPLCAGWLGQQETTNKNFIDKKCTSCGFTQRSCEKKMRITEEMVLMGRAKKQDLAQELQDNLEKLVEKMNLLLDLYGKDVVITSGYRTEAVNSKTPGAAPSSKHMICAAVDIADVDNSFMTFCLQNLDKCKEIGVYFEDFRWTPTWTHCQILPPKSSKRIFVPDATRAQAESRWNGVYDHQFDE